jgi:pimeloyl-ACP methyl ester carboxylesterase
MRPLSCLSELPRYKNIGPEGYQWTLKNKAGTEVTRYVEPDAPMKVAQHPVQDYAKQFPTTSEVLIIHGTRDDIVPTSAASGFTNAVAERGVRFRLHLVDGADHNLRGQ